MASPTNYNTLSKEGVDVSVMYTVTASTTPETPAPPFAVGDICEGINNAAWVFVQASTSITYNDFVVIKGTAQANSMTTTTIAAAGGAQIGVAPGSTSAGGGANPAILAGVYFWAQIRGNIVAGNAIAATSTSNVALYTSATAGIVSSTSTGQPLGGIVMTASATANPQTFQLTWPRVLPSSSLVQSFIP